MVAAANPSHRVTLTIANHAQDVILTPFWAFQTAVRTVCFWLSQIQSTIY